MFKSGFELMVKINSYGDLRKFIREKSKEFPDFNLKDRSISVYSTNLLKLANSGYKKDIDELIKKGKSNKFVLLSDVVGKYRQEFSITYGAMENQEDDVKEEKNTSLLVRLFRTYVSGLGIICKLNPNKTSSLGVEVLKPKKIQEGIFTEDFPIYKLENTNGKDSGTIKDAVLDLKRKEDFGIDYLFHKETGNYVTPIHCDKGFIAQRLKATEDHPADFSHIGGDICQEYIEDEDEDTIKPATKGKKESKKDKGKKVNVELMPLTVFIGEGINDLTFGFGRCFPLYLYDDIFWQVAGNFLTKNHTSVDILYENTERVYLADKNKAPAYSGTVYSTNRYAENFGSDSSDYEVMINPPCKFIPSLEHFKEELRPITMEDVVKLFTPSEMLILKLTIGRALIGSSGSFEYMNKGYSIYHDWRKSLLVLGRPKIGKSTILEYVKQAMEFCGFTVAPGQNLKDRFNLKQSALSDLTINDDMREDQIVANLDSDAFKTLISGGIMYAEEKNKNKEKIQPKTVVIGNANSFSPESLYGIDDGAKDRFITIYAKAKRGERNPYELTNSLADQLGVTPLAIWVRILRDCFDTALNYCSVEENNIRKKPAQGLSINTKIDQNNFDSKYYFDTCPGLTFIVLCAVAYATKKGCYGSLDRFFGEQIKNNTFLIDSIIILKEYLLEVDPEQYNIIKYRPQSKEKCLFFQLVKEHWDSLSSKQVSHPYLALRELDWITINDASALVNNLLVNNSLNVYSLPSDSLDEIIQTVRNRNGTIRKACTSLNKDFMDFEDDDSLQDNAIAITNFLIKKYKELEQEKEISSNLSEKEIPALQ